VQTLMAVLLAAGLLGVGTAATVAVTSVPPTASGGMMGGMGGGMHGDGPMQGDGPMHGDGPMPDHDSMMGQGMGGCHCCQTNTTGI